jgi:hypothetical protein
MILIGTHEQSKGVRLYLDSLVKAGRMNDLLDIRRFEERNNGQDFSRVSFMRREEQMKIRSLYGIHRLRFC